MATMLKRIGEGFQSALIDSLDPRSQDWWLCCSPFVPATIIALYLLLVKRWGPAFMAQRAPFKIEPVIIVYNVAQVAVCFYIFWEGGKEWVRQNYSYVCQPVDKAVNKGTDKVANLVFAYYAVKITDLIDTIFFVLRKKFSHASFLHVYHHAGMIVVGYLACRYSLNGHFILLGIINSFVHVIMYSYYLYTALFPGKKVNISIKKSLTVLQLVQFCILVVHESLPLFQPNCQVQKIWCIALVMQYTFMIMLFSDFYQKAYLTPKKKTA